MHTVYTHIYKLYKNQNIVFNTITKVNENEDGFKCHGEHRFKSSFIPCCAIILC